MINAYISEIFSSYQGEGGNIRGSCFGKRQIFIRFSGCNIGEGVFDSKGGCFWCDTPDSKNFKIDNLYYEKMPSSQKFEELKNPIDIKQVKDIIKTLITKDLHSISFTGGEPLCQLEFILNLSELLKKSNLNFPLYLETNGSILPNKIQMNLIAKYFKYCCCDLKDKSSKAASEQKWKHLIEKELDFISEIVSHNIDTFAKIVVTSLTSLKDIEWICNNLSKIFYPDGRPVGLAIQPSFFRKDDINYKYSISIKKLNNIFYLAANYLSPESLTLSIQAHKYIKLL